MMINSLSIKNKKLIIALIIIAIIIPFVIFLVASASNKEVEDVPEKPPLPTFPDAPSVEQELIIKYSEGKEFDNLPEARKQEINEILSEYGVISQERAYKDVSEGELTRSYLLKFNEGVDVESAAQKIYELPEIEGAQPNTEFGLF